MLIQMLTCQMAGSEDPGRDLMRAGLAEGEMVLLVCGGGPAGEAAAHQHIEVTAEQRPGGMSPLQQSTLRS
jgi:hypothetical protein